MNAPTIQTLISRLITREGGYVDHPADRGGPTNFGITQATLSSWLGYSCTPEQVEALDDVQAREIYHEMYWIGPGFHQLNLSPVVIEMLFDTAVHSGPSRAVRLLQEAIGVKADGHLGPITQAAADRLSGPHLAALFIGQRTLFIGRLISESPSQAAFAAGWAKRLREFIIQIPLA